MRKSFTIVVCILSFVSGLHAQKLPKADEIHLRVNKVLLKRALPDLIDEIAHAKNDTVDAALFALDVFSRADRADLMRRTLLDLSTARDLPPAAERRWLLEIVRQKILNDIEAQRIYYDVLADDDGYYSTNPFIEALSRTKDCREVDAWLEKRAVNLNSWGVIRLERSIKNGTVRSILDGLAVRVRAEPGDAMALNTYLGAVVHVQEYTHQSDPARFDHEADWLYDFYPAATAKAAYDLGVRFESAAPSIAIKYYLDSLSRAVSDDEVRLLQQADKGPSYGPARKINWEKQLRYWTKQRLAAAYKRTGQSVLAQPLIEELMATKGDDIFAMDDYRLAGAVQSQSGARAIESKVLRDAAGSSASPQYWMDRIQYYSGRNDMDGVVSSFREAMAAINIDGKARFIDWFAWSVSHSSLKDDDPERHRGEMSRILTEEFGVAPVGSDLSFKIISAGSSRGLGLSEFMDTFFYRRQDLFSAVFAARPSWNNEEKEIIVEILRDKRLSADKKRIYISELERLAAVGSVERRLQLAEIYSDAEEHALRIPLLAYYADHAPPDKDHSFARSYALTSLFDAYVNTGNWRAAEKLMADRSSVFLMYIGSFLERLAVCAGQQNAPEDAFRIWMKAVNFSGHSRFGLINLADTTTKPLLKRYYEQMKQKDPTSRDAEQALAILR